MKKRFISISRAAMLALAGGFALLALLAFVMPQNVQAAGTGTAGNTVIRNTVTVTYKDAANNPMQPVTGQVDVTVAVAPAPPALNAPTDQSTSPGTASTYTYWITSRSNGPGTYPLTTGVVQTPGISGSTAVPSVASVDLGATTLKTGVTIAAGGTTTLDVPTDGTSNASVNGIEAGDKVSINGQTYTVASIDDSTAATVGGTATITVTGNGTASAALPAGTLIEETKSFNVTVTPGTVAPGTTTDQTITVTTTSGTVSDVTVTTVNVLQALVVVKQVSASATGPWSSNPTGLSFAPGIAIWYKITVTNNGTSNATSVTVIDPVPDYTTYVNDTTTLNGIAVHNDGATSPLIGAGLPVDDNSPVRAAGAVATGILHPAGVATVIFSVTVNN